MRRVATVLICVTVWMIAADVAAQHNPESKRDLVRVTVRLSDRADTIKGRLIALGPDEVRLLVQEREVTIPLDRVAEVRKAADPILDGALKGAAVGGLLCLLGCGQGADSPSQAALVPLAAALGYGGVGALIDWGYSNRTVLFPAPR